MLNKCTHLKRKWVIENQLGRGHDRPLPAWTGVPRSTAGYRWARSRWSRRPRRRRTGRPGVSRRTAARPRRARFGAARRRASRVPVAPGRCRPARRAAGRTTTIRRTSWRRARPARNCTWNSSPGPPWRYAPPWNPRPLSIERTQSTTIDPVTATCYDSASYIRDQLNRQAGWVAGTRTCSASCAAGEPSDQAPGLGSAHDANRLAGRGSWPIIFQLMSNHEMSNCTCSRMPVTVGCCVLRTDHSVGHYHWWLSKRSVVQLHWAIWLHTYRPWSCG